MVVEPSSLYAKGSSKNGSNEGAGLPLPLVETDTRAASTLDTSGTVSTTLIGGVGVCPRRCALNACSRRTFAPPASGSGVAHSSRRAVGGLEQYDGDTGPARASVRMPGEMASSCNLWTNCCNLAVEISPRAARLTDSARRSSSASRYSICSVIMTKRVSCSSSSALRTSLAKVMSSSSSSGRTLGTAGTANEGSGVLQKLNPREQPSDAEEGVRVDGVAGGACCENSSALHERLRERLLPKMKLWSCLSSCSSGTRSSVERPQAFAWERMSSNMIKACRRKSSRC
mmetsp:Transcript_94554/g.267642  ORF Transcript_94554/g.267642 Transcript_94554/m.267642 type:complete len:286 (-) Transcript_94554:516-1373(-)